MGHAPSHPRVGTHEPLAVDAVVQDLHNVPSAQGEGEVIAGRGRGVVFLDHVLRWVGGGEGRRGREGREGGEEREGGEGGREGEGGEERGGEGEKEVGEKETK